jgi:hypothetical protein
VKINKSDADKAYRLKSALEKLGAEHLLNAALRNARHAWVETPEHFKEVERDVKSLLRNAGVFISGTEVVLYVDRSAGPGGIDLGDGISRRFDLREMLLDSDNDMPAFLRAVADEIESKS